MVNHPNRKRPRPVEVRLEPGQAIKVTFQGLDGFIQVSFALESVRITGKASSVARVIVDSSPPAAGKSGTIYEELFPALPVAQQH